MRNYAHPRREQHGAATRVFLAPFISPTLNLVDKWRIVDLAFVLDIASRGVDETRREYSFYC